MICLIDVNFIKDISFHISIYGNVITTHDWTTWTSIFDDDGRFEIYETNSKIYISNEIYNIIRRLIRYTLETQEVLDDIKPRFFGFDDLTFGFKFE